MIFTIMFESAKNLTARLQGQRTSLEVHRLKPTSCEVRAASDWDLSAAHASGRSRAGLTLS